jgi:hypothetical protein
MNRYPLVIFGCFLGSVGCTASTDNGSPPAPSSGCTQDSSVSGCDDPSTGYSCDNGDTPDQEDSSLVCSVGTPSGDLTLYCCIQFTSSTCSADPSVQGCTGDSFGFSCTGTDTPDEADSSLNCSTPTPGAGGASLYCCSN